jgi:hypothetical protein
MRFVSRLSGRPMMASLRSPVSMNLFRRPLKSPMRFVRYNSSASQTSRVDRILARLPPYLQRYTTGLRNAPLSHVVSFLILHEITAIIPLFALFGAFHYTTYLPFDYVISHWGGYVQDGVAKFEKYFRKKGWFGFGQEDGASEVHARGSLPYHSKNEGVGSSTEASSEDIFKNWSGTDEKYKILMEVALAWAITKAILPARIVVSVWATPWFARAIGKARGIFRTK